jgi:hypothetical protein
MNWSQLKKRIENTFADSVRGRVEIWLTHYRRAHDQEGEAWITIDKKRIFYIGTGHFIETAVHEADRRSNLRYSDNTINPQHPEQFHRWWDAYHEAREKLPKQGIMPTWEFEACLLDYLNTSIDDIINSDNPIIKALGMLDKRLGKRRLRSLELLNEHPLVMTLYKFRYTAEGLHHDQNSASDATIS